VDLDLDLPENLGTEVEAAATANYLAFRACCPKPLLECDHQRHLLRFYVVRTLARSGYRPLLVRPVVRVGDRTIRVDVAARRGERVVVALCEYPAVTRDVLAKLVALGRAEHVEVLLVRHAQSPMSADVRASLDKPDVSRRVHLISVKIPPSQDLLYRDSWIYAEILREGVEAGSA